MRLLLVSPRFPPSSAADSQRLRMLLPHFSPQGVEAEVLAVDPGAVAAPLDPWQAEHLPAETAIHRVPALPLAWARLPGLGSIEARSLRFLAAAGDRLLAKHHFDLVYFSTTAFGSFALGPRWQERFGVPFVLDYQDPWVNDHYREHPELRPPGGRFKHAIADRLSRHREPRVLRHAAGITAVSAAYPAQLEARYPFAAAIPSLVLPFPGSATDFQNLDSIPTSALPFDPGDGLIHWVSVGRGGADLEQALAGLFQALADHAPAELRSRLRLHFLGTSYAPDGQGIASIQPLAERFGLGALVQEVTDRLPLSRALACLKAASALLVIGSNDPSYTASKLYPYLLARRPLLAIMHRNSSVVDVVQRCGGGRVVTFESTTPPEQISQAIAEQWLLHGQHLKPVPLDASAFARHTAAAQAEQLVAFFRDCLSSREINPR